MQSCTGRARPQFFIKQDYLGATMNKIYFTAAVAAVALAQSSISVAEDSGFMVTPSIGFFDYEDDRIEAPVITGELDDDLFGSLGLGYRFANPWAVELVYKYGETETKTTSVDVKYQGVHLDGLYHFDNDSNLTPYLAFGAGYAELESDANSKDVDETNLNAGGGVKFALNDLLSLRADLRAFRDFDEKNIDVAASLGLQFLFGGEKPAVTAVDGDADGDGIKDSMDQCPNTASGIQVDNNGCAFDSDGDGVANHQDNCPDSEAGALVKADGCYQMLTATKDIELEVNFANNSAEVTPAYYAAIQQAADFIKQYPESQIVIEGHSDDRGAASYNQSLSERRASSVAQVLITQFNISADRISSVGYGEEKPIADNTAAAGRAANRRVMAVISASVEMRAKK